jgi:hypothetical protein
MDFKRLFYTFTATIFLKGFVPIDGYIYIDLYKAFEQALVTSELNLFRLQLAFFDPSISESATSILIIATTCDYNKSSPCTSFEFEWVSPQLSTILHSRCALSLFYGMDPVSTNGLLRSRYRVSLSGLTYLTLNITGIPYHDATLNFADFIDTLSVLISWVSENIYYRYFMLDREISTNSMITLHF